MLVQDHLTGQLHDVPDEYAGDGYGFPALLPILGKLAPMVLPAIPSIIDMFTKGLQPRQQAYGYAPPGYGYADDVSGYGDIPQGQVVYDGFGNPVGWAPLANIARSVASTVAPMAQQAIRTIAPLAQQAATAVTAGPAAMATALNPLARVAANMITAAPNQIANTLNPFAQAAGQALQNVGPALQSMVPRVPPPMPMPHMPMPALRVPPGWVRPAVPFTGRRPVRAYMRCSVWPGPAGFVPVSANQPMPVTAAPAAPVPTAAAMPIRRRRRR